MGVWAQLIFCGFQTGVSLVSLSPGFGGVEKKKPNPNWLSLEWHFHVNSLCFPASQANQNSSSCLQLMPRVA